LTGLRRSSISRRRKTTYPEILSTLKSLLISGSKSIYLSLQHQSHVRRR